MTPNQFSIRSKIRGIGGFPLFLGGAIALAFLTPQIGSSRETLSLHSAAYVGVLMIFFFYGLGMSIGQLWQGLANWRLHLLVQSSTFVFFPLITLAALAFPPMVSNPMLRLSIFFAAALPSTVSSSVVMVSIARGNVPAAIFNAGISSLLGVFLTPLWMSLFLTSDLFPIDLASAIRGIVMVVALPMSLGMILNPLFGNRVMRSRKYLRYFDQTVVILIVYTSFCDSFAAKAFADFRPGTLVGLGVGMVLLFFAVYFTIRISCRLAGFNREDTITALFCGSKKSLMHGSAMSRALFATTGNLGVVLLPIMLYHALQIVIVSVFARWYSEHDSDSALASLP